MKINRKKTKKGDNFSITAFFPQFEILCGPGEIRTLVQTWNKLCFLHAYLPFNCREGEGWPIAYTVFLMCFISSGFRTLNQTSSVDRCPVC